LKARKVISRVADLPSTFSLARYSKAAEFLIQDWLVNLEFRTLRWQNFNSLPEGEFVRGVEFLFKNPLLPAEVRQAYWATGLTKDVGRRQVLDQTVFDALVGHYYFDLEETRFAKFVEAFENYDAPEVGSVSRQLVETPMWEALQTSSINDDGDVFVKVNLHASEEQLKADFDAWLKATKTARSIDVPKRRVTAIELKQWAQFQVLAFLDLTMWAQSSGHEITNQVLGLVLFPDEFEVVLSDRIRKVIAPLARRLSTFEFCTYLRAQAVADMESKHAEWVPAPWQGDEPPAPSASKIFPEQ
jgi:hypothetical protein